MALSLQGCRKTVMTKTALLQRHWARIWQQEESKPTLYLYQNDVSYYKFFLLKGIMNSLSLQYLWVDTQFIWQMFQPSQAHSGDNMYTYLISGRVICHWGQLHVLHLDITPLEWGSIDAPWRRLRRRDSDQLSSLQHLQSQRWEKTPIRNGLGTT